ncbi:HAD-IA family hydrolase [Aestuariibius insulae]|uniref:HAD-IA family hydrolase n=1 Tax=Aestuariibius insulae TaxID=2058287 RepID=UPI00345E7F2A
MTHKALFFGAIGTLAETSDMQRRAFNAAFDEAGLSWNWGETEYRELLKTPGGKRRVRDYADARSQSVDADEIHARKVAHFKRIVGEEGLQPREGVLALIDAAKRGGLKLGFVTSTGQEQIDLILSNLGGIDAADFDYIGERGKVENSKPAPDIYQDALQALSLKAEDALAIEDTPESAEAALAAGIDCVAFPGGDARGRNFPEGTIIPDGPLGPELLNQPQAAE